jgi:hypothetical protein
VQDHVDVGERGLDPGTWREVAPYRSRAGWQVWALAPWEHAQVVSAREQNRQGVGRKHAGAVSSDE